MGPAFLEFHSLAVRIAEAVEPGSLVISLRIDDERVAFPVTNSVSVPSRIRIFGQLSIHDDFPRRVRPFKDLDDLYRSLNELGGAGIQPQVAGKPDRIATADRIVAQRRHNSAWTSGRL